MDVHGMHGQAGIARDPRLTLVQVCGQTMALCSTALSRSAMRAQVLSAMMLLVCVGCATHRAGSVYSRAEAGKPWIVQEATVVQINDAVIEGRDSAIGTIGGGLVGHSLGRAVGAGTGSRIAGAVGAVAGAVAGQKVEKAATQQKAWEILIDVEEGVEQLVIVQPADQSFSVGEKVRVYTRSD